MAALKRTEAETRAAVVSDARYDIRLDLRADDFDSRTRVTFTAPPGATTFVDVKPAALRSASLNGAPLDTGTDLTDGRLQLRDLLAANELIVDARMAYSHDGEGLVRHVDPADGETYLYAMSFLNAAPRWFACFDQPDLKAPVTLHVSCPEHWTVAGNGPAVRTAPGTWTIEQARPVATYMTTLIAGPYVSRTDEHDGIPLAIHARASLADALDRDAGPIFAHTKACFDECHRLFGVRYPWGEYHQAFVPDFNAGAMENPGCVTFRDELMFRSQATEADRVDRANTIAHEMAHMWFGDLVTMRWWDDLWLNESFAEYVGHRVCATVADTRSWVQFGIDRKSWGYAADRRPSTHPVAGEGAVDTASALDAFDGISYAKGAASLRQLAERLGDEVFLGGLRAHIEANAFANAALADLVRAWREAGADDIDEWVQQWLRTSGLDTLRVEDGVLLRESPDGSRREHAVSVTAYAAEPATQSVLVSSPRTPLTLPSAPVVLPDSGDVTWAKIALPAAAWEAMPDQLADLDAAARVVVWNALQLAVADAELSPDLALRIVAATVPHETLEHVVNKMLAWARGVARWSDDPAHLESVAATAQRTLDALPPATRLVAARALVATTSDADLLQGWLAGRAPEGVEVDRDVRWRILARLCALGAAGERDVDAALADDNSSEGAVRAALCRASLPQAGAKAAAWRLLTADPDAANSTLYAVAEGFWQANQRELTGPYVERYFAEIAATARLRSGWVVGRVAARAYPRTHVDSATVAATEALLADPSLPTPVRRAVTDEGDDLRRAVAVRRTFGF